VIKSKNSVKHLRLDTSCIFKSRGKLTLVFGWEDILKALQSK